MREGRKEREGVRGQFVNQFIFHRGKSNGLDEKDLIMFYTTFLAIS
jgi:hypothetical protein